MFTVEKGTNITPDGRKCSVIKLGEYTVCRIVPWLFSSCSVAGLEDFRMCPTLTTKQAVALGKLLDTHDHGGWVPKEFYFLISDSNIAVLKEFLALPQVKLMDEFANKAHGPNTMHLYRYSTLKDFK